MTGKHRQSEVTLRQSERLMTSYSQAPPNGMRLVWTIKLKDGCSSGLQYDGEVYVGVDGGLNRVAKDGQSSRVILLDGIVWNSRVHDGMIYTMVSNSDSWSVRVYSSDYRLVRSWRHSEAKNVDEMFCQLEVGKTVYSYLISTVRLSYSTV